MACCLHTLNHETQNILYVAADHFQLLFSANVYYHHENTFADTWNLLLMVIATSGGESSAADVAVLHLISSISTYFLLLLRHISEANI